MHDQGPRNEAKNLNAGLESENYGSSGWIMDVQTWGHGEVQTLWEIIPWMLSVHGGTPSTWGPASARMAIGEGSVPKGQEAGSMGHGKSRLCSTPKLDASVWGFVWPRGVLFSIHTKARVCQATSCGYELLKTERLDVFQAKFRPEGPKRGNGMCGVWEFYKRSGVLEELKALWDDWSVEFKEKTTKSETGSQLAFSVSLLLTLC